MMCLSTSRRGWLGPDLWTGVGLVLATVLALWLRLPLLAVRPMHGDEAVHAVKFDTLWQDGDYAYDPNEYHGPTLYYLTLPVVYLSGARSFDQVTEVHLRLVPVLAGVLLVPLLWLIRDGLGRSAAVVAGVLTALSPALTFYSRYYIQETLLVFFTALLVVSAWRAYRTGRLGWAVLAGVAAGCMHATKETCVIAFGCLAVAYAVTRISARRPLRESTHAIRRDRRRAVEDGAIGAGENPPRTESAHHPARSRQSASAGSRDEDTAPSERSSTARRGVCLVVVGVVLAGVTSVALFSVFFTHPQGPIDSIRALTTYLHRAGGDRIHDHPWYTYLQMLGFWRIAPGPVFSEGLILGLFVAGGIMALFGGIRNRTRDSASQAETATPANPDGANRAFVRFVAVYAVLMLAVYSAIPYKTPWCILGALHAMVLVAGVGAVTLVRGLRRPALRFAVVALLIVLTVQLYVQARRDSYRLYADPRNPYVYAQPVSSVVQLAGFAEKLADAAPDGRDMLVKVIGPDYWPIPWYLRGFGRVGYWDDPPDDPDASLIIANEALATALDDRLVGAYARFHYGLRPDVSLVVYVETGLYDRWLAQNKDEADGVTSIAP